MGIKTWATNARLRGIGRTTGLLGGLCLVLATSNPAQAQFRFPRPGIGYPQRVPVQPQQQDICAEYGTFGTVNRLIDMHISCWHRKFRPGRLSAEPYHPSLALAASVPTGAVDAYGLTEKEWLELGDAELLARLIVPERMNNVLTNFRSGDAKAMVAFYMAGQLANEPFLFGPKPSPMLKAFGIAYPACKDADLLSSSGGDCAAGFANLRRRFRAAGIGQPIMHGGQQQDWYLFAFAISRAERARTFPRTLWLASASRPESEPYSAQDATNLVDAFLAGVGPAGPRLQQLGNTCSGSRYVVAAMASRGLTLQAVTEQAVSRGSAEAAMQYAQFARAGSCGVPADKKAAFNYTLKAAQLGDVSAMRAVSQFYSLGEGVAANPREAIAWAQKSGETSEPYIASLKSRLAGFDERTKREGVVTDVAGKAPNVATIRAVLLREMRWAYENHDFGLQSGLSAMFGNQTDWDETTGTVEMGQRDTMGQGLANLSTRSVQSFFVTSPTCTPSGSGYSCRYTVSTYMDAAIGAMKLANQVSTKPVTVTDQFTFENGRWRSATVRARMLSGLRPGAGGQNASGGKSGLCKSLNAGVVAAGGRSTSAGLDPSTWGC